MKTYAMFAAIADACNLSAAFTDRLKDGKGLSDTGKVDFRGFAALMDKWAFIIHAKGNPMTLPSGNRVTGFTMTEILCGKFEIVAEDFKWRGNESKNVEPHPMAGQFVEWCGDYLRERFPQYTFERTVSYAAPKRKAVAADVLAGIGI